MVPESILEKFIGLIMSLVIGSLSDHLQVSSPTLELSNPLRESM